MPIIRGKNFNGVRLLHVQLTPDTEYIFPHQLRKRFFPNVSREQFHTIKKNIGIKDKSLTSSEIKLINNNIGKSGGATKVNDNCTLILVEDGEILYRQMKLVNKKKKVLHGEIDDVSTSVYHRYDSTSKLAEGTLDGVSCASSAVLETRENTAKKIPGGIVTIEIKDYENIPLLHVLFESGEYYIFL